MTTLTPALSTMLVQLKLKLFVLWPIHMYLFIFLFDSRYYLFYWIRVKSWSLELVVLAVNCSKTLWVFNTSSSVYWSLKSVSLVQCKNKKKYDKCLHCSVAVNWKNAGFLVFYAIHPYVTLTVMFNTSEQSCENVIIRIDYW